MLRILLYGAFVHALFLCSIFVIYFQSPVIRGLRPLPELRHPPADRLVLIVADGLRAESFYRDGCARTPFLRSLILGGGVHGISHTRIPTESRPGHVALIAGLYEDPSAVLRGWQRNPVDFDSVFNRSRVTHAWGSPDILSVFEMDDDQRRDDHIRTHTYDPSAEDFSGGSRTALLDEWVFDRVAEHLRRHRADGTLHAAHPPRTVLFLHLLGLDTAGHVHKPNSAAFDENLRAVDAGIERTVRLVHEAFGADDARTAFVFTADHGMTDAGAHGAGEAHETQTPFVAWGAGVADWPELIKLQSMTSAGHHQHVKVARQQPIGDASAATRLVQVPAFEIEQADAAPLMSALLGSAVPVNNVGRLPYGLLNVSAEYRVRAFRSNALQVAEQFGHLRRRQASGWLAGWLGDYAALNEELQRVQERQIDQALASGRFEVATHLTAEYLNNALSGIEYYQQYYQHALLFAVSAAMIGWLVYLLQSTCGPTGGGIALDLWPRRWFLVISGISLLSVGAFVFAQGIPLHVAAFFVLPIICWLPCRARFAYRLLIDYRVWLFAIAADALVYTFFRRAVLGALFATLPTVYVLSAFEADSRLALLRRNLPWIGSCALLGAFTLLPVVGRTALHHQHTVLCVGLCAWLVRLAVRAFQSQRSVGAVDRWRVANFALATGAVAVVGYVARGFGREDGLSAVAQAAAWLLTGAAIVLPVLQSREDRVQRIADSLCQPYMLMSLSYEPLFLLVLAGNLECWRRMEARERSASETLLDSGRRGQLRLGSRAVRRAYVMLAYVLVSFFGTGNLASISSFDPSSVRCFVGTFAPFVMAALIVWKLFVPVLLVVCASTAIGEADVGGVKSHRSTSSSWSSTSTATTDTMFVCVLLICDIMCVHFLFLVRNRGSWLDIGVSISHFVIMESTVLVLVVLTRVARKLLHVELLAGAGDDTAAMKLK